MNTFVETEFEIVQKPAYMEVIQSFVMTVLSGDYSDHSKQKYNHLLLGTLKLLIYTLNFVNHTYDNSIIFKMLLKEFLFSKTTPRVKHDTTVKALYESIKKILFTDQNLIYMLIEEVSPLLRNN